MLTCLELYSERETNGRRTVSSSSFGCNLTRPCLPGDAYSPYKGLIRRRRHDHEIGVLHSLASMDVGQCTRCISLICPLPIQPDAISGYLSLSPVEPYECQCASVRLYFWRRNRKCAHVRLLGFLRQLYCYYSVVWELGSSGHPLGRSSCAINCSTVQT